MTHALQIDTLAFSKKLREAGADEKLAEAIVEGLTAADTSELATKGDLAEVQTALKEDIRGVRTELKEDIRGVRTELKEDIRGVRTGLKAETDALDKKVDVMAVDLHWIKLIGGGILAVLILPWIRDLAVVVFN